MKTSILLHIVLVMVVSGLLAAGCQHSSVDQEQAAAMHAQMRAQPKTADDVLIVDCLLPGQIRRLGGMTYLTPRRPIKSTAFECGLRGGEYTAFDRSNYRTALNVWLPQAQEGDRLAQTYVGEIYMKGLGVEPQYEQAALWFEKAADQGFDRAQINLGYLYEMGLGVPRDSKRALNLYREATGLEQSIAFEQDVQLSKEEKAELERLRGEVDSYKLELDSLQRQLSQIKMERSRSESIYKEKIQTIEQENKKLALARSALQQKQARLAESSALGTLTDELHSRENKLEILSQQATRLEGDIAFLERKKASLSVAQGEIRNRLLEEISQQETALRDKQLQTQRLNGEIESMERRKNELTQTIAAKMKGQEASLADREEKILMQSKEAERLSKEIALLDVQAKKYRQQLDVYQQKVANFPGPEIEILDPRLMATRGKRVIEIQEGQEQYQFVGKVTAPAGLYSFRVNDAKQSVHDNGMFKVSLPLSVKDETQVRMVAVDEQGKMGHFILTLARPLAATVQPALETSPPATPSPRFDFGRYQAMIIGNNDYKNLPPLTTAVNDAKRMAEVLEKRYGFNTTLMINATRFDIYTTLDKLGRELTEKDNFLIYYAGHGELDEKNRRGYWLPVDADADSHVNSISNQAITDILNNMSVKQAIIIADTCYSGIMTRSVIAYRSSGLSDEARFKWYTKLSSERCRTVLSSGGLRPILDVGIGEHSIFTGALIDVLDSNSTILEAGELYRALRAKVSSTSKDLGLEQVPQYAANLLAGHQSGDFLFVPKKFQM